MVTLQLKEYVVLTWSNHNYSGDYSTNRIIYEVLTWSNQCMIAVTLTRYDVLTRARQMFDSSDSSTDRMSSI